MSFFSAVGSRFVFFPEPINADPESVGQKIQICITSCPSVSPFPLPHLAHPSRIAHAFVSNNKGNTEVSGIYGSVYDIITHFFNTRHKTHFSLPGESSLHVPDCVQISAQFSSVDIFLGNILIRYIYPDMKCTLGEVRGSFPPKKIHEIEQMYVEHRTNVFYQKNYMRQRERETY